MPTRVLAPTLPHPSLSWNVVKTVVASAMGETTPEGDRDARATPRLCTTWTMPSAMGSARANRALKRTEKSDTAMVRRVPCQVS